MWANFRLPVSLLLSLLLLFSYLFGLIVKQIFEEKGKFIFIFLQIP